MAPTINRLLAVHPGKILREDFRVPLGLSANALAVALRVPATCVREIVNERRGITADTAAWPAISAAMPGRGWPCRPDMT